MPFYPPNSPKNDNFTTMKKTTGDIIIFTHVYQKSWSYDILFLRYGMWRIYFWAIFCPLPYFLPLQLARKVKISKKWKKTQLEISSFYTSVPKIMIIWYTVSGIQHVTDVIVIFHFGLLLVLLPRKMRISKKKKKKKKKTPRDTIILHKCTKNHDQKLYYSWDMAHDWCNSYFSFWAFFLP